MFDDTWIWIRSIRRNMESKAIHRYVVGDWDYPPSYKMGFKNTTASTTAATTLEIHFVREVDPHTRHLETWVSVKAKLTAIPK
jgi:hypothetical protein